MCVILVIYAASVCKVAVRKIPDRRLAVPKIVHCPLGSMGFRMASQGFAGGEVTMSMRLETVLCGRAFQLPDP